MLSINFQIATDKALSVKRSLLRKWVTAAVGNRLHSAEVTIRIVDPEEMIHLNHTYRHKNKVTNVLSFPFEMPEHINMDTTILGDIVICADVVNQEAKDQNKTQEAHWAHMVVHSIFHLLGYDHEVDEEAETMEALEIDVMKSLGYANPYETGEDQVL